MGTTKVSFTFEGEALCGQGGPIFYPSHHFKNVIRVTLKNEHNKLPRKIVLKKKDTENDTDGKLFQTEQLAYEKLRDHQGSLIPTCHGLADVDGSPALVLTDVGGDPLHELLLEEPPWHTLKQGLETIRDLGIVLQDLSLMNIQCSANNTLVFLDLEEAEMAASLDRSAVLSVDEQLQELMGKYARRQGALKRNKPGEHSLVVSKDLKPAEKRGAYHALRA